MSGASSAARYASEWRGRCSSGSKQMSCNCPHYKINKVEESYFNYVLEQAGVMHGIASIYCEGQDYRRFFPYPSEECQIEHSSAGPIVWVCQHTENCTRLLADPIALPKPQEPAPKRVVPAPKRTHPEITWARYMRAYLLRRRGFTFRQIGKVLSVTAQRARQLVLKGEKLWFFLRLTLDRWDNEKHLKPHQKEFLRGVTITYTIDGGNRGELS